MQRPAQQNWGGICCIPLFTRGEIWTNTNSMAFGKKGQSNWREVTVISPVLTLYCLGLFYTCGISSVL